EDLVLRNEPGLVRSIHRRILHVIRNASRDTSIVVVLSKRAPGSSPYKLNYRLFGSGSTLRRFPLYSFRISSNGSVLLHPLVRRAPSLSVESYHKFSKAPVFAFPV